MDPALISANDWRQLAGMLNDLYVATGLGIASAMAFLLAHAVLPSLTATNDAAAGLRVMRPLFYGIFAIALGLTCYALARVFVEGVSFLDLFYPRYGY
ncbi:MAG TPA: hypothetical protein VK009_13370 [Chloroflexota bacterium]|nr:hypothetical protein [Chloroflexota bacterium]